MQREIKFRGKSKLNNEWLFGDLLRLGGNRTPCIFSDKDSIRDFNAHNGVVIPETTGQFTGLKDKNGVEIYEGDIFLLGDKTILYVVEWIDSGFQGRQISNKSTVGLEYWQDRIEIIGNIHDNPELINKIGKKE